MLLCRFFQEISSDSQQVWDRKMDESHYIRVAQSKCLTISYKMKFLYKFFSHWPAVVLIRAGTIKAVPGPNMKINFFLDSTSLKTTAVVFGRTQLWNSHFVQMAYVVEIYFIPNLLLRNFTGCWQTTNTVYWSTKCRVENSPFQNGIGTQVLGKQKNPVKCYHLIDTTKSLLNIHKDRQ